MHVLNREHEPALTHGLEVQVQRIQAEEYLRRGVTLTTEQALAEIDRRNAPRVVKPLPPEPVVDDPFPYRRDLALAEAKLIDLGYSDEQCDAIIADIRRSGSAWGCEHFENSSVYEHTVAIEAILDQNKNWNRFQLHVNPRLRFEGSAGRAGLAVRSKRVGYGAWANTEHA